MSPAIEVRRIEWQPDQRQGKSPPAADSEPTRDSLPWNPQDCDQSVEEPIARSRTDDEPGF